MAAATPSAGKLARGFERHKKGEHAAAERDYRAAIKAEPGNPDALYLMGMLCLEKGRAKEAAHFLDRAVRAAGAARPGVDPGWRLALGTARRELGEHAAALAEFDAALAADPASVDALFCRATALHKLARNDEAVAAYEAVLKRAPTHAEAANNLGALYRETARPEDAQRCFRKAVELRPDYADAVCNLGTALSEVGLFEEALPFLERAAAARPDDVELLLALLMALMQSGSAAQAVERAERFIAAHREPSIMGLLGAALMQLGRKADAAAIFREALALAPFCAQALCGLAELDGEAGKDEHIEPLRTLLANTAGDPQTHSLWAALGRHLAAQSRHADSFAAFSRANVLKRELLHRRGHVYDRRARARYLDRMIAACPAGGPRGGGGDDSRRPVFVIGMPRSGTTLTEQILAGHPDVFGAGELHHVGRIVTRLEDRFGYPDRPVADSVIGDAAGWYLKAIGDLAGGAARAVDKMPGNFAHAGLIIRMFPNARIVHCRRDPMDTCLSCFMQDFGATGTVWTTDMEDLAHYYCQYSRIMAHWRAVLPPENLLEIDYEDTVADLEGQARRLVDFVGLPWDPACLRFHEVERTVTTSSHAQVRRKIYTSSVGRWKRYGDGVLPLARALDACGRGPGAAA